MVAYTRSDVVVFTMQEPELYTVHRDGYDDQTVWLNFRQANKKNLSFDPNGKL